MNDATRTITASRRPIIPEQSEFRFWIDEKIRNMDTDQFGHVNNAAMSTLFEAGRMEIFLQSQDISSKNKFTINVARILINFHAELFYPSIVAIGSMVNHVGNTSFTVKQGVFHLDKCIASAEATCVLMETSTRRPIQVPDSLRRHFLGFESPE